MMGLEVQRVVRARGKVDTGIIVKRMITVLKNTTVSQTISELVRWTKRTGKLQEAEEGAHIDSRRPTPNSCSRTEIKEFIFRNKSSNLPMIAFSVTPPSSIVRSTRTNTVQQY